MPARLERITLRNFKSFRSAVIPFAPGFTAIMGPNGSGKSNIIDAIVFVLGEGRLKLIRASRLKDLVFHKARDGRAVVSIDIVSPDGEKYQITREIDKRGQSVYRLNGKRTTKSNVVSLLSSLGISSNGYNIVLQGDITRVIKMTPKERRTIIDEVAGVAEYEQRKQDAMKELESVNEKIKDAELILGERRAILDKLKEERDAALRYQELSRELKSLRKSILLKKQEELKNSVERIRGKLDAVNAEVSRIENEVVDVSKKKEDAERELEGVNEEIRRIYSTMGEGRLQSLREELMRNQTLLESLHSDLSRIKEELIDLGSKKDKIAYDVQVLEDELRDVRTRKQEKERALSEVTQRVEAIVEEINKVESEKREKEKELLSVEEQLAELREKFTKLREEHSRLNAEYNTRKEMEKKQAAVLEKVKKAKEELEKIEQEIKELERSRKEVFELEKSLNTQYLQLSEEIKELREVLGSYRGAASALKSLGVDVEVLNALKRAQERGELFGIHDFVFNLIRHDKKYSQALMAAAGRRMFYIVVDTADAAAEAIKYLKKNRIGSATFIPMDRVSVRLSDVPHERGVLGRAIDFVRYDEKYARAMAYVFGDTLVVEDIDTAKKLAGKYRAVTLDGDVVERSGIMSGGARKGSVDLFQILAAESKRAELSEKEAEAKSILSRLQEIRDRVRSISSRLSELNARREELTKFIESAPVSAEDVFAQLEEEISRIESEMESIANQISDLEMKKALLTQEIRREGGADSVNLFQQLSSLRQEQDVLNRELNELALLEKEKEERLKALREKLEEIDARLDALSRQKDETELKISALESEIEELNEKLVEAEKQVEGVREKLESLNARREALDATVSELLRRQEELMKKKDMLLRERYSLESRLDSLQNNLLELEMDLSEYRDVEPLEELPEDPNARVTEIIEEMRSLEPVNMRAIQEYDEMSAKIREVEERIEKLKEEKKAVLDLMEEIERKKEKAFMDAFLAIRKRFKEVYRDLEIGDADLRLTDESDIFNSGLIIEARPKGKELINIDAMSGGEKSMVAIAFMLAIALYQPSAFYILDEPDQALDKINAEKVARYIKKLSRTTQFIVVSHRDVVLKEADQIIGVYMKGDGSSAIEVKLPSAAP